MGMDENEVMKITIANIPGDVKVVEARKGQTVKEIFEKNGIYLGENNLKYTIDGFDVGVNTPIGKKTLNIYSFEDIKGNGFNNIDVEIVDEDENITNKSFIISDKDDLEDFLERLNKDHFIHLDKIVYSVDVESASGHTKINEAMTNDIDTDSDFCKTLENGDTVTITFDEEICKDDSDEDDSDDEADNCKCDHGKRSQGIHIDNITDIKFKGMSIDKDGNINIQLKINK